MRNAILILCALGLTACGSKTWFLNLSPTEVDTGDGKVEGCECKNIDPDKLDAKFTKASESKPHYVWNGASVEHFADDSTNHGYCTGTEIPEEVCKRAEETEKPDTTPAGSEPQASAPVAYPAAGGIVSSPGATSGQQPAGQCSYTATVTKWICKRAPAGAPAETRQASYHRVKELSTGKEFSEECRNKLAMSTAKGYFLTHTGRKTQCAKTSCAPHPAKWLQKHRDSGWTCNVPQ